MYSFPNFEPVHCSMSGSNCCFLTRHSQMTKNSNPEEVRNNRGEPVANLTSLEEFPGEQGTQMEICGFSELRRMD